MLKDIVPKTRIILGMIVMWNIFTLMSITWNPSPSSPPPPPPRKGAGGAKHNKQVDDMYQWLAKPASPRPPTSQVNTRADQAMVEAVSSDLKTVEGMLTGVAGKVDKLLPLNDHVEALAKKIAVLEGAVHSNRRENMSVGADSRGDHQVAMQTLLLPLGPNDYERFENLYLSMSRYFSFKLVKEWIIVMPDKTSELANKIKILAQPQLHLLKFMDDTEVIPEMKTKPTTTWMTQQLIKLGVADFVSTPFYLILDADLICFKPTCISDLIINDRAVTNVFKTKDMSGRGEWWDSSSKLLDMPINPGSYFGVTPSFMSTEVVKGLHARIETVHKKKWSVYLLENVFTYTFTEYTLYAVYAYSSGLFELFHVPSPDAVYNHAKSVWFKDQFEGLDMENIIKHKAEIPGHFLVVQSNTEIPAGQVRTKMAKLFS